MAEAMQWKDEPKIAEMLRFPFHEFKKKNGEDILTPILM